MVIPSLCSNWLVAKKYSGMGLDTLRKVFFTNKGRDGFSYSNVVTHTPLQCSTDRHLVVVKAADLTHHGLQTRDREGTQVLGDVIKLLN